MNPKYSSVDPQSSPSRRRFLKAGAATLASGLIIGLGPRLVVRAAQPSSLRIALVGCGRRGTAIAKYALETSPSIRLVAVADAFSDRLDSALLALSNRFPSQVDVPPQNRFTGLTAYLQSIPMADAVILGAPSGFLPSHLEHAIDTGKHALAESPVATDAPGVRRVLTLNSTALNKGLRIAVINSRRFDPLVLETVVRLRSGDIGNIVAMQCHAQGGPTWVHLRKSEETEMIHQVRNWPHFVWLSGDRCCAQLANSLDVVNWVKGAHPSRCWGMGGRQVMTGKSFGETYDHASIEYEYPDLSRLFTHSRQIPGCWNTESERFLGSQGVGNTVNGTISGDKAWRYEGRSSDPLATVVARFLKAVEDGTPHNDLLWAAEAALTTLMGRMAAYSGKMVTWDQALSSTTSLFPTHLDWNAEPGPRPSADGFYPSPIPGVTTVV